MESWPHAGPSSVFRWPYTIRQDQIRAFGVIMQGEIRQIRLSAQPVEVLGAVSRSY